MAMKRLDETPLGQVLAGTALASPPIWLMRQAGRYLPEYQAIRARCDNFLDLCFSPDLAAEVTLQPVRRFGLDAAILFADILTVPWALGADVAFAKGTGPHMTPLAGPEDLAGAAVVRDRLAPVFDTVRRVAERLQGEPPVIGFAGAPWTLACYLLEGGGSKDFPRARRYAYENPAAMARLVTLLEEATVLYLDGQIRAGAQVVKLFDSWAGVLAPAGQAELVTASHRRLVAELKARHPNVPVITFPRGIGPSYRPYSWQVPADAVALDTAIDPHWAAAHVQDRRPVQGNIDPVALVAGGEALARAMEATRHALGTGPWIANLGHGVLPETPPGHVEEMIGWLRS